MPKGAPADRSDAANAAQTSQEAARGQTEPGSDSAPTGGLTIVESATLILLLIAVLYALVGATDYVRRGLKRAQCARLLRALDHTLTGYQVAEGDFPPGAPDRQSRRCLQVLTTHPSFAALRQTLPPVLRDDRPGRAALTDPWSRPLRYITAASDPGRANANAGRPVFESAGPDRHFGDTDPGATLDNLATDEPLPP